MPSSAPNVEMGDAAFAAMEKGLVDIFSDLAEIFGNPPSHGAIYGLLFSSERPLSMDEITARLGISKGSASQGLRHLEALGAVFWTHEASGRSRSYMARLELKPLLSGLISKRLLPRLAGGEERLRLLEELVPSLPESSRSGARERLERLTKWHRRAAGLLPLAQKLLQ